MGADLPNTAKAEQSPEETSKDVPHPEPIIKPRETASTSTKSMEIALTVIAVAIFICLSLAIVSNDIAQPDPDKVATDWQKAVYSLGLTAVFPPSEDVQVGDIFAVEYLRRNDGLFFRTIQLAHVAKTKDAIKKYYHELIHLPSSPSGYDGKSPVLSEKDIFAEQDEVKSLPMVALPGIVFTSSSNGSAGGGIPWWKAFLGFERKAELSIQIRIPEAETYGIPSAIATSLLDEFCVPDDKKLPLPPCTESYMRRELSSIGWRKAYASPANEQLARFRSSEERENGIYLRFVRRVFLTRQIEYSYGTETMTASEIRERLQTKSESSTVSPPQPSIPGKEVGLLGGQDATNNTAGDVNMSPDAKFTIGGVAADKVSIIVPIARPLTIGYESITAQPYPLVIGSTMEIIGVQK